MLELGFASASSNGFWSSTSSSCGSDDESDYDESASSAQTLRALNVKQRVKMLQLHQACDVEVRKRLISVWKSIFDDSSFLEVVAVEFESKGEL